MTHLLLICVCDLIYILNNMIMWQESFLADCGKIALKLTYLGEDFEIYGESEEENWKKNSSQFS